MRTPPPTFETLNESRLHHHFKIDYADRFGGLIEQEVEGKVCDVVTPAGDIIEIQTTSLARQAPKVAALIETHKFRLVYPLVTEKVIETYEEGKLVSRRRSPKKQNIYSIFRELTGLYPWLCHPNFTLDVVCVKVAEEREKTPEPVQLINRSRHFKRAWYKRGKRLLEQGESRLFTCADDYLALLPPDLGTRFTVREVN
jgi:hypothetical protein